MNKSQRMQLKAIAVILGTIVLIVLGIIGIFYTAQRTGQPEGTYISREDAGILLHAAGISGWEEAGVEEAAEYITFRELLNSFENQKDMKEGLNALGKKYQAKHFVLLEDWYEIYDLYLQKQGLTEMIAQIEITPLGFGTEVVLADGNTLAEKTLMTPDAIYAYEASVFENYRNQTVSAYMKEGTLLTVRKLMNTEFQLNNVWVMEVSEEDNRLLYFWNDCEVTITGEEAGLAGKEESREQIADLTFSKGILVTVQTKMNKINGKLLGIADNQITIENAGSFPLSDNLKIYQIYEQLARRYTGDLRIGYDFTDFVIEDGKVEACLITRDEAMENIRVLIRASNYSGTLHSEAELTADTDFTLRFGTYDNMQEESFRAGETLKLAPDSGYFSGDRVYIIPAALTGKMKLLSVERSQGTPQYRGQLEILKKEEGLAIVNEVLLEEYLYCVVPSEMPASYPLEALKAQAVCARTYAYQKMLKSGLPAYGAHVDDSSTYQVYNNIKENSETSKAVRETQGQLLYCREELTGTYYYSTSCGFGTTADIWKSGEQSPEYLKAKRIGAQPEDDNYNAQTMTEEEVFRSYLQQAFESDYESKEGWYRWSYQVENVDAKGVFEILKKRYEANSRLILTQNSDGEFVGNDISEFDHILELTVMKRGLGGVIDELLIKTDKGIYKVISEHNVRYVLNNGSAKVLRQDGSEVDSSSLLPSAFFVIDTVKAGDEVAGYTLYGGGFGHGVGMSQNGARSMAASGMTAAQILNFFYDGSEVKAVY